MTKPVADSRVASLLKSDEMLSVFRYFEKVQAQITERQIEICQIPAPPFGERDRAEFLREKFVKMGFPNARIDREGNVLALARGRDENSILVVSAHLDTVFPLETKLEVRREGSKIYAPGIMDDGCGLAALMTLAETWRKFDFASEKSILFVGTVGEEGAGNLRGVRHLCTNGELAASIAAFISLDGAGASEIVHRALGSKRYKLTINGGGGHSFLDFGTPNPIAAAARVVSLLTDFKLTPNIKTTYNAGKIAGGTSVNSIPTEAVLEIDLRSESETDLRRLDEHFRQSVFRAVEAENARRDRKYVALELDLQITGERPSGATDPNHELVRFALQATFAVGQSPQLTISSTDANFPMSLGIPSVTLGAGGNGANMHTLDEWYDPTKREIGLQRALLLMAAFVELI